MPWGIIINRMEQQPILLKLVTTKKGFIITMMRKRLGSAVDVARLTLVLLALPAQCLVLIWAMGKIRMVIGKDINISVPIVPILIFMLIL